MSRKGRSRKPARRGYLTPAREAGQYETLYALKYRLDELLLVCRSLELRTADDMTVEVWGRLRAAPRRGLLRLAADHPTLEAAVAQAFLTARELERPYLPVVSLDALRPGE